MKQCKDEVKTTKELAVRNDVAISSNYIMIKNIRILKSIASTERNVKSQAFAFELLDQVLKKDYARSSVKLPILIPVRNKPEAYMMKLEIGSNLVQKVMSNVKCLKGWKSDVLICSAKQFIVEPVLSYAEVSKRGKAKLVQKELIELFSEYVKNDVITQKPFVSVRNAKFIQVSGDKPVEVDKAKEHYSNINNLTFLKKK